MPSLGRLCLVLHGHLPYVLHHGGWPHGETWLFEGAVETYIPLLELLDELAAKDSSAVLTIGLTPVLLEQLASEHFKTGLIEYVAERIDRARDDAADFGNRGDDRRVEQADRWRKWYAARLDYFESIARDIPTAFARHARAGQVELLTSAATHGYLPLLGEDGSIRAQLHVGASVSEKHLGFRPKGMWLPECGYRPASESWEPPVLYRPPRPRAGIESFVADAGITHFFVDTHLIAKGRPAAVIERGTVKATNDALVFWDNKRGWGNPLDPVGVASDDLSPKVFALARHPHVSEQVWSDVIGYPGADEYLDFHHRHGDHGLRYDRITSHHTPPDQKQPYDPDKTAGKAFEHATHFCSVVRKTLAEYTKQTGRIGTVVAPFDAELFGHWWFEGPAFLRDVLLMLDDVDVAPASAAIETVDKVMRLPEGSWGEGGGHHVWLNDQTTWMWETIYRAEDRFTQLVSTLPWRTNKAVESLLQKAARELLLTQSSDWPFVVHTRAAGDYGRLRFAGHATRFDRLATMAAEASVDRPPSGVQRTELAEADAHDDVFAEVDLALWEEGVR